MGGQDGPSDPSPHPPGWRRALCRAPAGALSWRPGAADLLDIVRVVGILVAGSVAGLAARVLHLPLPFVLGPLFLTAAIGLAGLPVRAVRHCRPAAQVVVGAAIGVQFTRAVVLKLAVLTPLIVGSALLTIAVCGAVAGVMIALTGLDRRTAFFATAPAGAAEMANIAARHGGEPEPIMVAQTMRVVLTVSIAPFLVVYFSNDGTVHPIIQAAVLAWPAVALLALAGILGGLAMSRTGFPYCWFIGPLLACALVGALGVVEGRVPDSLLTIAQVVIGCSLGAQFRREFLTRLLPTMLASILTVSLALAVMAVAAIACAYVFVLPPAAMVLAFAPAGMAEMTLTGKVLGLDATLISGFHVVRIVLVMLLCVPAFRLFDRLLGPVP